MLRLDSEEDKSWEHVDPGTIQAVDEVLTHVRKRRLSKPPVKL